MHWMTLLIAACLVATAQQPPSRALTVTAVEGEGAILNVRQTLARSLVVEVRNSENQPVAGAQVTFQLPDSGPSGMFLDDRTSLVVGTDERGRATARVLRPNNVVGQYDVRVAASYRGEVARTLIPLTNAAPLGVTQRSGSRKALIILGVAGAAVAGVVIASASGGGGSITTGNPAPRPTPPALPPPTIVTPEPPVVGRP